MGGTFDTSKTRGGPFAGESSPVTYSAIMGGITRDRTMHRGDHGHGGFPKPRSCSPHRPRTPPSDPAVPAAGIASTEPSAPASGETPPLRGRTGGTATAESRGQAACEPSTPPYLGRRRYAERARLRERADRQSKPSGFVRKALGWPPRSRLSSPRTIVVPKYHTPAALRDGVSEVERDASAARQHVPGRSSERAPARTAKRSPAAQHPCRPGRLPGRPWLWQLGPATRQWPAAASFLRPVCEPGRIGAPRAHPHGWAPRPRHEARRRSRGVASAILN